MLNYINKLARSLAVIGGIVLILMILITCLSIFGRILNSVGHTEFIKTNLSFSAEFFQWFRPITGDYELVEAGAAIAIFMFLPWCQLNRKHASVELFTSMFPKRLSNFLAAFWEVIFALVIILITWRLYEGMIGKISNGETTFLLQMPVWWAYAISTVVAFFASVVAIFSAWLHVKEMMANDSHASHEGKFKS